MASSKPISSNVAVMQRQHESMWVGHFLSGLLSFDGARSQILGSKELPSLSEIFSRLCQATLPFVALSLTDHSVLVAFIGPSRPSGLIIPLVLVW